MRAYLNGQFLPLEQARISPLDRGFLFGDGVYEVIPVYDGEGFLLKEHLDRLDRSLKAIDMKNPLTHEQWLDIINELSKETEKSFYGIYLQITRGAGATRQHLYNDDLKPTVFAMVISPMPLSADDKAKGVAAITAPDERWKNCYIKSINLLPNILALQQGQKQGAYETIFVKDGFITEGTGSNVFMIKNNIIFTTPQTSDILWGITRAYVLKLAKQHDMPYVEREITAEEFEHADEIWMTSSTREVLAITRLNGKNVGDGLVGPVWKKINQYFQTAE